MANRAGVVVGGALVFAAGVQIGSSEIGRLLVLWLIHDFSATPVAASAEGRGSAFGL